MQSTSIVSICNSSSWSSRIIDQNLVFEELFIEFMEWEGNAIYSPDYDLFL